jgi:hypothetical protein
MAETPPGTGYIGALPGCQHCHGTELFPCTTAGGWTIKLLCPCWGVHAGKPPAAVTTPENCAAGGGRQ